MHDISLQKKQKKKNYPSWKADLIDAVRIYRVDKPDKTCSRGLTINILHHAMSCLAVGLRFQIRGARISVARGEEFTLWSPVRVSHPLPHIWDWHGFD